jgi:hypothetical protein
MQGFYIHSGGSAGSSLIANLLIRKVASVTIRMVLERLRTFELLRDVVRFLRKTREPSTSFTLSWWPVLGQPSIADSLLAINETMSFTH